MRIIANSWDKEVSVIKTFETVVENFGFDYKHRLESKTIDLYQRAIREFIAFSEKPIQEIKPSHVRNWILALELQDYSTSTINTRLYGLKLFYKYCIDENILNFNPIDPITFPTVEEALPHYLQNEQLEHLRRIVKDKPKLKAVIELLYSTGIRISELSKLKIEDINWSERIIHITNGKRKKERIVLFTRQCEEYLKAYLKTRDDDLPYLFVNRKGTAPFCRRTLQLQFEKYKEIIGLHLTPHTLRHTFAAHLSMKGMPIECIQVLLGHTDPQQTHLYARLFNHARKQQYDELM